MSGPEIERSYYTYPMSAQDTFRKIQAACGIPDARCDGLPGHESDSAYAVAREAALQEYRAGKQAKVSVPAAPITPDNGKRADERSETAIATLHPRVQPIARKVVLAAKGDGITIIVTSGTRTYAEQDALYAQGRSTPGSVVTNAKGGQSNHNFGVAFDVTIFDGAKPVWDSPMYKHVGALGESFGLQWGGRWTTIQDEPHFELKPDWAKNMSEASMLAELRSRHSKGEDAFA